MLKPQIVLSGAVTQALLLRPKPFLSGNTGSSSSTIASFPIPGKRISGNIRTRMDAGRIGAIFGTTAAKDMRVTVTVTVKPAGGVRGFLDRVTVSLDDLMDLINRGLQLELVAAELDTNGEEKTTVKGYARKRSVKSDAIEYVADLCIPSDFGDVGAIRVENEHNTEMFIPSIVLTGFIVPISFSCQSWVASKDKRIFFSTKSYLPSETPNGLKRYRDDELIFVRGDGRGTRKMTDRIYDYDVYNDLGDPDGSDELGRPVLGGEEHPYPRRCRTGRPRTKKNPLSESRSSSVYVPRDEAFSEVKTCQFGVSAIASFVHRVMPLLVGGIQNGDRGFPFFTAIDSMFNEAIHLPQIHDSIKDIIPNIIKSLADHGNLILQFDTPELVDRDKFAWMRDEEFSRQTLAGINPCTIQSVKEWPLKSELDPEVYGPQESAITKEYIEQQIKGFMTFDEALRQKKLFMLDYHDIFLPYVEKVRNLGGSTLYGSRTVFFLAPDDTLMPVAIELTCPKMNGKPQWKHVFRPCWTATGAWLWKLAKAHVLAHDSGVHQLVSHWLRTHCCTEPYIIATHRQLSEMHPIYRLLHPHFRFTLEMNALAREALISAGGVIERTFSPLKYSMEISSVVYDKLWQFDLQALPADLISRGMAEPDPTAEHGLKLTIKDYPFANDGLILWDILKKWVTSYVTHYYTEPKSVESDKELQAWWTEIRTVGHGDKKDATWWPALNTRDDLVGILTTIMWVASGFHAAVNFGQYDFAGYFPNRPTIARTTMPNEDESDKKRRDLFMRRPEVELLSCFPSQEQAIVVMGVLNILSTHSPDEEYLGDMEEPAWEADPVIKDAFLQFQKRLKELEIFIDEQNADKSLRNRTGAGVVPYELLKPSSEAGVTSKGIPYSISI